MYLRLQIVLLVSIFISLSGETEIGTSEFSSSRTKLGTGSGQNSSGVKLQSILVISGRPNEGQTCKHCLISKFIKHKQISKYNSCPHTGNEVLFL
jgi:hypothetical protein